MVSILSHPFWNCSLRLKKIKPYHIKKRGKVNSFPQTNPAALPAFSAAYKCGRNCVSGMETQITERARVSFCPFCGFKA